MMDGNFIIVTILSIVFSFLVLASAISEDLKGVREFIRQIISGK